MYNQHHKLTSFLTGILLLAAACVYSALSAGAGEYPHWWTSGGVINTNATATNDFAAVNQGQVKWIALKAYEELAARLRGGAGSAASNMIAAFSATNNYVGVNLGQLKYLAQPFYDRLILAGYTNAYPWTATATDDVSHALANIGQVKNLFSFDLKDSDEDGMPDWWEIANGLVPTNAADGEADSDGDGISNALEYRRWTNPQDRQSANLTFYVNATNGSDSYDGLSPFWNDLHGPKRTIGNAIFVAISTDRIEVAEGTYSNEPAIYLFANKKLTLRPNGSVIVR